MRIKLLLPIFLLLTISAFAQVSQSRFELPLRGNQSEAYRTLSLDDHGLLLYGLFIGKEDNAVELIRLDTTFKEVWKGFLPVPRNLFITGSRVFNDKVFLLLKDRFNPLAEFVVFAVQIENGNYVMRNVKTMLAFVPSVFRVTKEAVIIGGYFNYRPLALYYSFNTNQSKILPGFTNEVGELNQLTTDDEGNIDIVVAGKDFSRKRSLWLRSYDRNGDLVKTILLRGNEDMNLLFGRTVNSVDGNQIVSGVYGRFTEYSRGIFIAKIDAYGEYTIKYYNYADLDRFFNYMKARREQRVKERIERRKIRGKKVKFNYRVLVDDLLPYGDQFVMLGEAFYPHYSYPSNRMMGSGSPYGYAGRNVLSPSSRGELVFDGYQYTHAVVIGFDKDGNLTWDNSFEINDVRTYQLEQFVKIHPENDRITLFYLFDNIIRSKIIKDADVLEGKSFDPLATGLKDDVVRERDTQQTKLEHWYGNVFYASGIQQIRNKRDQGINIWRRVFFINKIEHK